MNLPDLQKIGNTIEKMDEIHTAAASLMEENKNLAEKSLESMRTALHLVAEEKNRLERSSKEEIQNLQKQLQEKENTIRYLQSYKENNNVHLSEEASSDSTKHRKQKGFFSFFKKKDKDDSNLSLDHFIQEFIDSGDFSKAQVDFLVDCEDINKHFQGA